MFNYQLGVYPTLLISYVFDILVKVSLSPSFFFFYHGNTRVSTLVLFFSQHVLLLQISFSLMRFLYNVFTFSLFLPLVKIYIYDKMKSMTSNIIVIITPLDNQWFVLYLPQNVQ